MEYRQFGKTRLGATADKATTTGSPKIDEGGRLTGTSTIRGVHAYNTRSAFSEVNPAP
jgi:hypothetical protein